MPLLQHHQHLFSRHGLAENDPELPLPILEDSSPRDQVLHDLMDAHAPWGNTWIARMFTVVMGTSTLAAVVWIGVSVWRAVSGH